MSNRLLAPDDLPEKGIRLSNSQRWRKERDGTFPRRVRVSDNRVAYVESEIEEWITSRIAARDAQREVA